jgi:hypothetical protein
VNGRIRCPNSTGPVLELENLEFVTVIFHVKLVGTPHAGSVMCKKFEELVVLLFGRGQPETSNGDGLSSRCCNVALIMVRLNADAF